MALWGCAPGDFEDTTPPGLADDDSTAPTGDDDTTPITTTYDHFCGELILGGSAQAAWEGVFSSAPAVDDGNAPHLVFPQDTTRYSANWPAPAWNWNAGAGGANLFLLEATVATETCPLRILTTDASWTVSDEAWSDLRWWSADQEALLTVTGAVVDLASGALLAGPWRATSGRRFGTLSFSAPGRIVYWTTSTSSLQYASIGDSSPSYFYGPDNNGGNCVGCHEGTPDGQYMAVTTQSAAFGGFVLDLFDNGDYTALPGLTGGADSTMHTPVTTWPAFSSAYWTDTDRRMVAVQNSHLVSINLLTGTVLGVAVSGDALEQGEPTWSPDGTTIAYASSSEVIDGRTSDEPIDLYQVPYNDGSGGAAQPIPGAADPYWQEYYPSFSPDGQWLVYNRALEGSYFSSWAEVMVIPAAGGTGVRLLANDPPPETGQTSPGLTNSWPRWAPAWQDLGADRWYFLTFSSNRQYGLPQVWIAPWKRDGSGAVVSYPALHLPGQDLATSNHTPVWLRD